MPDFKFETHISYVCLCYVENRPYFFFVFFQSTKPVDSVKTIFYDYFSCNQGLGVLGGPGFSGTAYSEKLHCLLAVYFGLTVI